MLEESVRRLAKGANFASLATVMPNGSLQVQVMWVDCDDDHVLINTEVHRQKYRNITANPTVTVLIISQENAWDYVEVRGKVVATETGPHAKAHLDSLALKYLKKVEYPRPITSERVIVKIKPERVVTYPST